jgi:cytochrome c-type biogenesis protein CcmH/NrfG
VTYALPTSGPGPDQRDVDAVRQLLDDMDALDDNDQRARYLLSSDWMRTRGAAASNRLAIPRPRSRS